MAEQHNLRYIAFGITQHCAHRCKFCYETANRAPEFRRHGELVTLMQLAECFAEAGVEFVELVGGDPSEHPEVGRLTEHLHRLGIEVGILSNTHRAWQEVAPYVTALEWTVHGPKEYHDAYTFPGTYDMVLERLKGFAAVKREDQKIGLTINFTSIMAEKLYDVVQELSAELNVDYVQLQRVGPFGGAADGNYTLSVDEVLAIYRQIQRIDQELKIGIEVVDSYPLCILPEDLRQYTARCDWGFGTAYVDMHGNISRCAVNQIPLGNLLDPGTSLTQLWQQHSALIKFREKEYLPEKCQRCELLPQCGGGCPSSCGGCELSKDQLLVV